MVAEGDKVFAGSIPEIYDRYLVPLIFQSYAEDIARRVRTRTPNAVLEIASGTGAVTREMAAVLSPGTKYVATDFNQPMLDYAKACQAGEMHVSWRQADAQDLPFEDASFDVVCCQFGVMFFHDRVTAYREAKRVLKPRGLFIFNVWDRIEENVFAANVTDALAELFSETPPRFLARTPHGYHDVPLIRSELQAAGFKDLDVETKAQQSPAPSPRHPAVAYCHGTPLRTEIESKGANALERATDHAAKVIASRHGNGGVSAKIQAHVVAAAA